MMEQLMKMREYLFKAFQLLFFIRLKINKRLLLLKVVELRKELLIFLKNMQRFLYFFIIIIII